MKISITKNAGIMTFNFSDISPKSIKIIKNLIAPFQGKLMYSLREEQGIVYDMWFENKKLICLTMPKYYARVEQTIQTYLKV